MRGVKSSNDYKIIKRPVDLDEPTKDLVMNIPKGADVAEPDTETFLERLYFGDSWFGSVKSVENVLRSGDYSKMRVKRAYARSPTND